MRTNMWADRGIMWLRGSGRVRPTCVSNGRVMKIRYNTRPHHAILRNHAALHRDGTNKQKEMGTERERDADRRTGRRPERNTQAYSTMLWSCPTATPSHVTIWLNRTQSDGFGVLYATEWEYTSNYYDVPWSVNSDIIRALFHARLKMTDFPTRVDVVHECVRVRCECYTHDMQTVPMPCAHWQQW